MLVLFFALARPPRRPAWLLLILRPVLRRVVDRFFAGARPPALPALLFLAEVRRLTVDVAALRRPPRFFAVLLPRVEADRFFAVVRRAPPRLDAGLLARFLALVRRPFFAELRRPPRLDADFRRPPTRLGLSLRDVEAISSSSCSDIDSYIPRDAPLKRDRLVLPRLAASAAPAAFCCALDLAGMNTLPEPHWAERPPRRSRSVAWERQKERAGLLPPSRLTSENAKRSGELLLVLRLRSTAKRERRRQRDCNAWRGESSCGDHFDQPSAAFEQQRGSD